MNFHILSLNTTLRWFKRQAVISMTATVIICFLPMASAAQNVPEAEQLLKEWFDGQREEWESVDRMSFEEQVELSIDGAFAKRHVVATSSIDGIPRDRDWDRKVLNARINGRRANAQQYDRLLRTFWRSDDDDEQNDLVSVRGIAPRFVSGLQPENAVIVERENGPSAYRFDLRPRRRSSAIERVTLWFDPDTRTLIRSKVLLSPRRGSANMVVTTGYNRRDGLDIPFRRKVEGNFKSRRRLREFTTLVDYEAQYSKIVVRKRGR